MDLSVDNILLLWIHLPVHLYVVILHLKMLNVVLFQSVVLINFKTIIRFNLHITVPIYTLLLFS